jgi:Phage integrase, N-terminal SAM-like domain
MTPLRSRMLEELQLRNLSEQTAHTYVTSVERYAHYFGKSPQKLGPGHVSEYLLHLIRDNKAVPNTVLVNRAALRRIGDREAKLGTSLGSSYVRTKPPLRFRLEILDRVYV